MCLIHVGFQGFCYVDFCWLLCIKEAERLKSFAAACPLQSQPRKVPSNNRTCHEPISGKATISFGIVQIRERAICLFGQHSKPQWEV